MLMKVISGGQTGIDIAALRAAKLLEIATGGWMPNDWRTEDPRQPYHPEYKTKYGMQACYSKMYSVRTRFNVTSSTGTLILGPDMDSAGTAATIKACIKMQRPYYNIPVPGSSRIYMPAYLREYSPLQWIRSTVEWIEIHDIKVLNVAGNRRGYHEEPAFSWLYELFSVCARPIPG